MKLEVSRAIFDGAILKRGFWLYLVEVVSSGGRRAVYVGRTGDTSSPYAASLFARLTGHLNDRKSAKANSLLKRLIEQDLACTDWDKRGPTQELAPMCSRAAGPASFRKGAMQQRKTVAR